MSITRSAYANLELQPIAGQWRAGSTGRPLDVFDPYSQERLLTITLASREDLDEAYRKAREAQTAWAATAPAERARVMLEAVRIFDERREEIIDWLIRESGSTRIKSNSTLTGSVSFVKSNLFAIRFTWVSTTILGVP